MSYSQPKPTPGGGGPGQQCVKLYWAGDLFGNNAYVGGANNTGDLYNASQFGMSGIEFVNVNDRTYSTTYVPAAIFPANSANSNEAVGPCPANFYMRWFSANGTEVANNTNLAAEIIRVQIYGV